MREVGPLSGLRVVDFTWAAMGPYSGYFLAGLGAEVIQVYRPPKGSSSTTATLSVSASVAWALSVASSITSTSSVTGGGEVGLAVLTLLHPAIIKPKNNKVIFFIHIRSFAALYSDAWHF